MNKYLVYIIPFILGFAVGAMHIFIDMSFQKFCNEEILSID